MRSSSIYFVFALLLAACGTDQEAPADSCGPGENRCDGICVDFVVNPLHCGGCDVRCDAGEVCSAGACAAGCAPDLQKCGGTCVDTDNDAANCGGCGVACSAGMECAAGTCACAGGLESCAGSCIDTATDAANCGGCGIACAEFEACVDGGCVDDCAGERCGGACVQTGSDPAHCGGCGNACTGGLECIDGACGCPPGLLDCGGACIDPATDAGNCGGCGSVCAPGANATGATCEAGSCNLACADGFADCDGELSTGCEASLDDPAHCGSCETACSTGEWCGEGVCCGGDDLICGGACVDPLADEAHCGACDLGCTGWPNSSDGSCDYGACALTCADGFLNCNGLRQDGCEIDSLGDRLHCGACGQPCPSLCGGGACLTMTAPAQLFGTTCMLFSDGSVQCWGLNDAGQVGDGTPIPVSQGGVTRPHPVPLPAAAELATGPYHSCVRTTEGGVVCWGRNDRGQLGAGNTLPTLVPQTVLTGGSPLTGVSQLALTDSSTCALLASGQVQCWGSGANGRLGNAATADSLEPVTVSDGVAPLQSVHELAAGMSHVCARLADGTVRCWGRNNAGQLGLGDGAASSMNVATATPGLAGVDQVVAAGFRTCARIGGAAKCWGQNLSGQVGNGDGGATGQNVTSPADVLGVSTAVNLHIGVNHGFALLSGGGAMGWGLLSSGQLGIELPPAPPPPALPPSFIATPAPVLDPTATAPWTGLKAIVAGGQSYSCAIDAADLLWCWGLNSYGQLGNGSTASESLPAPVAW